MRKYCPDHTERISTRCETCWNVTKCHACHTKQGYATFETSNGDYFCSTPQRHGHSDLIADGCRRLQALQTVAKTKVASREHLSTPRPQTRTLLYTFGKSVSWVGTTTNQQNMLLSWSSCYNLQMYGNFCRLRISAEFSDFTLKNGFRRNSIIGDQFRQNWLLNACPSKVRKNVGRFQRNCPQFQRNCQQFRRN